MAVQPLAVSLLLPATGANPMLWLGAQGVFQGLLLLGYLAAAWFDPSRRSHSIVLLFSVTLAAIALPAGGIGIEPTSTITLNASLGLFVRSYAGPFVILCTFSVGLQRLYDLHAGQSPYWLFAVSNLGSLVAVLLYPIVVEPLVDLEDQLVAWKIGTSVLMVVAGSVGVYCLLRPAESRASGPRTSAQWHWLLRWFAGGFVPVGLSLASTVYLSLEFGSHPLVWLMPLSVYLATLAVAFAPGGTAILSALRLAVPSAAFLILFFMIRRPSSLAVALLVHGTGLTILIGSWQAWLVSLRPDPGRLGSFYVAMAGGGVAASFTLAYGAPVFLDPALYGSPARFLNRIAFGSLAPEYILLLLVTLAVTVRGGRPTASWRGAAGGLAEGALFGVVIGAALPEAWKIVSGSPGMSAWTILCASAVAISMAKVSARLGGVTAVLAMLAMAVLSDGSFNQVVEHSRSVFGQVRVRDQGDVRLMVHGTTYHGREDMPCAIGAYGAACDNPRSYYDREGPLGVAITSLGVHADRFRVAGIGLGVGSLGAYCRREWDLTFLEIDPNVLRVAEAHFGYLRRGRGVCNSLSVLLGDGRVLMRSTTDELDLIVADAFSSDSVPTHLLTREAVDEVTTKLGPTGVLAYHVSSRYFNLQELVEAAAVSLGLPTVAVLDRGEAESLRAGSRWVFVSRSAEAIGLLREQFFGPERSFEDSGSRGQPKMWTDARHSLWTVLGVG